MRRARTSKLSKLWQCFNEKQYFSAHRLMRRDFADTLSRQRQSKTCSITDNRLSRLARGHYIMRAIAATVIVMLNTARPWNAFGSTYWAAKNIREFVKSAKISTPLLDTIRRRATTTLALWCFATPSRNEETAEFNSSRSRSDRLMLALFLKAQLRQDDVHLG